MSEEKLKTLKDIEEEQFYGEIEGIRALRQEAIKWIKHWLKQTNGDL